MVDVLEMLHQFFSEGITWSSGIAIILAFLKLREGRHKRKVNEEIRKDIKAIKRRLDIWDATTLIAVSQASQQKRSVFSRSSTTMFTTVRAAGNFIKWGRKRNMKLNKVILVPLLTALIEFIKQSTGYEVPGGQNVDMIADVTLWTVTTIGILIHPKKDALSAEERSYM